MRVPVRPGRCGGLAVIREHPSSIARPGTRDGRTPQPGKPTRSSPNPSPAQIKSGKQRRQRCSGIFRTPRSRDSPPGGRNPGPLRAVRRRARPGGGERGNPRVQLSSAAGERRVLAVAVRRPVDLDDVAAPSTSASTSVSATSSPSASTSPAPSASPSPPASTCSPAPSASPSPPASTSPAPSASPSPSASTSTSPAHTASPSPSHSPSLTRLPSSAASPIWPRAARVSATSSAAAQSAAACSRPSHPRHRCSARPP